MNRRESWGKKLVLQGALLLGLTTINTSIYAQLLDSQTMRSNWGRVALGAAATVVGHELGHFIVAEAEGADAYFDNFTVKYKNQDGSDRQALRLSSAGFQTQWLISELAFYKLKDHSIADQKRALLGGLVLGHIAITAAYLVGLKDHEDGDTAGIAAASSYSSDEIALAIALPAAIDAWRLLGNNPPRWAPWVSVGSKALGVAAVWRF